MMNIIQAICAGCSCNEDEAREYLQSEVDELKSLAENNDLRCDDIRVACSNLGIDQDYEFQFITLLAS